ncbi:MAG TPA: ATP-dependent DNA ligase [Longimicrobiales bacterium]|nr:ATP-dependent DNA ligase [Longimicrobiales bacterium]
MRLDELVTSSARAAGTAARGEKIAVLADALRRASPEEAPLVVSWLSGALPQGRIGLGPAAVREAWPAGAASSPALGVLEVHAAFGRIAALEGPGSTAARVGLFRALLERATPPEQDFLARLALGELRQGALEALVADAVAKATAVPVKEVRRALQLSGDLAEVAAAARRGGSAALSSFGVRLFRPVQPMLAGSAEDPDDALGRLGTAALDWKLDGARVQVHRQGDEVRVYSRRLNEVTEAAPELVEAARALPATSLVLDGETIALGPDGRPRPFQETMRRFGRRLDVARLRAALPLSTFFFDVLYVDGASLLDRTAAERFAALDDLIPPDARVPRIVTADAAAAADFLRAARAAGHEGLVAKSLEATYDAGRRGGGWLKLKPTDTLDLVILAGEWGHGRRQGWLSNLHLGARDPENGGFVMLGKTFKGMTDAMLAWQTKELLARELGREGRVVHVRPELVAEIAFEGLQASPRYAGGLALRFARVKRYRTDKTGAEADTIARVREIAAARTA